ncbi:MAG: hypothetical protein M3220_13025 [Chloroflexota bacterium]|nr:hypothetical protein [Chloroflexota bacterium]
MEIALTRLFSTLYYPPYVFAVLSLAILGIGIGAAGAAWRARWRREVYVPRYMALAAFSALLLAIFSTFTPSSTWQQLPFLGLVTLPYLWIGFALATLFGAHADDSTRLYAADLVGAGAGALLAVPLLNYFSNISVILLAALMLAMAGMVVAREDRVKVPSVAALLVLAILGSQLRLNWLMPDMATLTNSKPIAQSLANGGHLLHTEWDSFARTDLVAPGDGTPYRLYMDGAAGSIMPPALGDAPLRGDIGFFPFATATPERVLVIGPGGGLDVWFALQSGATEIVGVEVNPASVVLVKEYASYNDNLYDQPTVRVLVDEGRSVLQRHEVRYDLIFLSQVVTLSAERSGYALTENTVYTVEAFQTYLDHLRPGGQVALKLYDDATLTRALSTALAALRQQGLPDSEAIRHTAAFLDPRPTDPVPLLLIRKEPFTAEEAFELGVAARRSGFVPMYLPGVVANPPLDQVEEGTASFAEVIAAAETNLTPSTDDRPFFFQFERGIPNSLQPLLWALTVTVSAGSSLLLFVQRRVTRRSVRWAPLYFAALGAGFIMVEVAVIQQARLFLGHPTLAITTVLAVLLIGSGLGSLVADKVSGERARVAVWAALGVAALLSLWLLLWPILTGHVLHGDQLMRIIVTAGTLLPLAMLMGIPFPMGLLTISGTGGRQIALAWAVNGVMTVVGSVGAVTIAIVAGFNRVLLMGIVLYLLAAIVATLLWSDDQ